MFSSAFGFDDQPRLARRAFDIAERMGARIVRVFSYWRSVDPDACFDRVASSLRELADRAAERSLIVGIENEHACNIATGAETARLLAAVDHPALRVIWDPANAFVAGEVPYPQGYACIPISRIAHVHAKDCTVANQVPTFGPLGEMGPGSVDWRGQLAALARDGYRGTVSLETHWKGPNGDKFQGSMICGRNLQEMIRHAGA
jgi:sugar phosphate isomerase/epimerase